MGSQRVRTSALAELNRLFQRVLTSLPDLGANIRGNLVESSTGPSSSWTLEVSVQLSAEEGEYILGSFIPDRAENSPEESTEGRIDAVE